MKKLLYISILLVLVGIFPTFAKAENFVKILLVPGHDNEVWGAQYGNTKEADMTLALAKKIFDILRKDQRFEVYVTRDDTGYTKEFSDYFSQNRDAISIFKEDAKKIMQGKISIGTFIKKINPPHHGVTTDTAIKLYGFNKWANDNKIDAVIHLHFNDYPRKTKWVIGKYKGFSVYFPDGQLVNWKESSQLAADIYTQLHKKYSTSDYKPEIGGLVPDQSLIALGSNGTLLQSVRSVLIEYGYIYEKKFRIKTTRLQAYNNMANLTVAGITNYFFPR